MRERLVVGNWKMNPPTIDDAVELAVAVGALPRSSARVGVAPPAVALAAVAEALRGRDIAVYAQDLHWEERGAFTGQISASSEAPPTSAPSMPSARANSPTELALTLPP